MIRRVSVPLVGCALLLAGCAGSQLDENMAGTSTISTTNTGVITSDNVDSEVHAFTVAAHVGEIEEGELASTSASAQNVRDFAQMMVRDHSAALRGSNTLGNQFGVQPAPAEDADAIAGAYRDFLNRSTFAAPLVRNHEQAMTALRSFEGPAFDRAYMDRQVALHRYVLAEIDRLLPFVRNDALEAKLRQDRAAVASHLQRAEEILNALPR